LVGGRIVENPFVEIGENGHGENKKTQVYLSKNDNPIVEKIYSKVSVKIQKLNVVQSKSGT
jgi:hypothetical protein